MVRYKQVAVSYRGRTGEIQAGYSIIPGSQGEIQAGYSIMPRSQW